MGQGSFGFAMERAGRRQHGGGTLLGGAAQGSCCQRASGCSAPTPSCQARPRRTWACPGSMDRANGMAEAGASGLAGPPLRLHPRLL
mmetsp:Transcript_72535/g.234725  ORF Transcript_72535/g.234725 Transcript_72535/m.234725 type:complete len:87 (-) Transcript_72535:240-500(-)